MSNIKTKAQKNKIDDEKRKSSLKEKIKAKQTQQNLIKNALSNIDQSASTNKLKFESDEGSGSEDDVPGYQNGVDEGKLVLFDESNDENEDYNLEVKEQFKGKEGLKLLTLQSTYGDDDRFKIDERFVEDEDENDDSKLENNDGDDIEENEKMCTEEEKSRQLQILGDVLGRPVATNESLKKSKKRTFDMVRYDESNEEHSKFLIQSVEDEPTRKRKKEKKSVAPNPPSKPVSKEKFYEVSSSIKQAFETAKSGFSLLQAFGRTNSDENGNKRQNDEKIDKKENYVRLLNSKKSDEEESSSDEDVRGDEGGEDLLIRDEIEMDEISENTIESKKSLADKGGNLKKDVNAQGVWKESFFFQMDDPRFKEGLEFINKKNSSEAKSTQETFDSNRGKLRQVFRIHQRKHKQKNNPFKKKVGGMKIKQNKFMKGRRNLRSGPIHRNLH